MTICSDRWLIIIIIAIERTWSNEKKSALETGFPCSTDCRVRLECNELWCPTLVALIILEIFSLGHTSMAWKWGRLKIRSWARINQSWRKVNKDFHVEWMHGWQLFEMASTWWHRWAKRWLRENGRKLANGYVASFSIHKLAARSKLRINHKRASRSELQLSHLTSATCCYSDSRHFNEALSGPAGCKSSLNAHLNALQHICITFAWLPPAPASSTMELTLFSGSLYHNAQ